MKKIIIVGGGISGLVSGIYGQSKGFETIVFEKHGIAGGQCTGWDRKGYHIDGCIHWLVGTKKGTVMNRLWNEVGALENVEIYNPESFQVYDYNGVKISLYKDLNKMRSHFLELSPEDKVAIEEFCDDIKILQDAGDADEKPMDLMTPYEIIKSFMKMKSQGDIIKKYGKLSIKDFAARFKYEGFRKFFQALLPENFAMFQIIFALGGYTGGNAGIPIGGSKAFALRVEKKYTEIGGKLKKNCSVKEVIIEDSMAKGVILENDEKVYGDYVISSCDTKITFDKLLKGKYEDKKLKARYDDPINYPLASNTYVTLGVDSKIEKHPRMEWIKLGPFSINKQEITQLPITNYNYEKNFAPQGKTLVTCAINQFGEEDYNYWKELYKDKEKYNGEKLKIANEVIKGIEKKYPYLYGKVEVLDVATPVTYNRYTGAYLGAFMPFLLTMNSKMMFYHNGKIKGLKNFYLSGQWISPPGGLPAALLTGKETIQRICKKEKISF